MVAFSYERKDSPWVYLKYGPDRDHLITCKTAIRKHDADRVRKLARELNRVEALVLAAPQGSAGKARATKSGWLWVQPYLRQIHSSKPKTRKVYLTHWRTLEKFLEESQIWAPDSLRRENVFEFLDWRTNQVKEKSGRSPKMNTAILELKILGRIMDEAVARGMVADNPARKLGLKREDSAMKPEITDEEIGMIRASLKAEPIWMQRSWELALQTGLRFMDTRLARRQVMTRDARIIIEEPKGGKKREFAIPLRREVEVLLLPWLMGKEPYFWTAPPKTLTGLAWTKFFRKIGLPHLCFHCTRVTFVSRGMRGGVPEAVMCQMVNHASTLINRIYQRWTSADLQRYASLISMPSASASLDAPPALGALVQLQNH